ncbi:MAG: hypothetical protein ACLT8E_11285 [Akkermansia sp.]
MNEHVFIGKTRYVNGQLLRSIALFWKLSDADERNRWARSVPKSINTVIYFQGP